MGSLLLLCSRLLRRLKTGVGTSGELVLELLNPSSRVYELQLARVERMANIANVNLQFLACTSGGEAITTTARDFGFEVLGVNAVFHSRNLFQGRKKDWLILFLRVV